GGLLGLGEPPGLAGAARGEDHVAGGLQGLHEDAPHHRVVVDDEDREARSWRRVHDARTIRISRVARTPQYGPATGTEAGGAPPHSDREMLGSPRWRPPVVVPDAADSRSSLVSRARAGGTCGAGG